MPEAKRPDRFQYRIADAPGQGSIPVGHVKLTVGEGLGCFALFDAGSQPAGYLLGFPIDMAKERCLSEAVTLENPVAQDSEKFPDHVLDRFGGRFAWLWNSPTGPRLYLDSTGQVPCVFDPKSKTAGATADSILDDSAYEARFDRILYDALNVDLAGWGVAGLTMHTGVRRLMPNHYLDLTDWHAVRHWPGPDGLPIPVDPVAAVEEFVAIIQAQYRALLSAPKRLAIGLTAGQDTRMLLACAKNIVQDIKFVTVAGGDLYARDTAMAHRIAAGERLDHLDLPRVEASRAARAAYLRRAGHCVADSNANYFPSVAPIADAYSLAGGAGGAIARGFSWSPQGNAPGKQSAAVVLRNLGREIVPQTTKAMQDWLDTVPTQTSNQTMDLAYIEHRMGHWAGAQFCSDPHLVRYAPFLTRRAVDLMLSLPDDWKLQKRLCGEVLRQTWPELSRYPFNSLGFWGDLKHKAHRIINDPALIPRKIRARF